MKKVMAMLVAILFLSVTMMAQVKPTINNSVKKPPTTEMKVVNKTINKKPTTVIKSDKKNISKVNKKIVHKPKNKAEVK